MFQLATNYINMLGTLSTSDSDNSKVIAIPADVSQVVGGLVNTGALLSAGSIVNKQSHL
ncbi:hypothetical protein [Photorhabdus aegyptia]|uniref:Uncharacterized protein n=1 Tax=Photorhabdus aegyptia TaxID=2805098 RepID=A0A022PCJ2_9GAMM|nr:hypothetical protein [Photorhabdus aegyptia]EYU13892.1 hypothetical protein BA1DRAFT_03576 [Photorhabdus aegyptia]